MQISITFLHFARSFVQLSSVLFFLCTPKRVVIYFKKVILCDKQNSANVTLKYNIFLFYMLCPLQPDHIRLLVIIIYEKDEKRRNRTQDTGYKRDNRATDRTGPSHARMTIRVCLTLSGYLVLVSLLSIR